MSKLSFFIFNKNHLLEIVSLLLFDSRSTISKNYLLFMKLKSISISGKDSNQSGVGKKFLIISISLTLLLNISIAIWFFMNNMNRFLIK